jgi:uncharacterized repeat protein (TIGR03843 family)
VDSDLAILQNGEIHIEGLIPDSSNGALQVSIKSDNIILKAIIKPEATIRPLWDFPERDLNNREYATYLLSSELGLDFVPPTVLREIEGIGPTLIQKWIEEIENDSIIVKNPKDIPKEYLKVLEGYDELNKLICLAHADSVFLRNLAIFDLVINNADRKGGHIIKDTTNNFWAIDHGVSWHEEEKIRTILWGWIGNELSNYDLLIIEKSNKILHRWLAEDFEYLTQFELKAAINRCEKLMSNKVFPQPSKEWPAVPWPIF